MKTEVGSIFIEQNNMKDADWKNECGFKNEGQETISSVADCFTTDKSFFKNHGKTYCTQYTKPSTGNHLGVICDNV